MRNINQKELNKILQKHEMWLNGKVGGECANLMGTDLSYANLRGVNLRCANLYNANLNRANLINADLRNTNLEYVNLEYANLINANLECVNLYNANLEYANLKCTNLKGADLRRVVLRRADLRRADLRNANLRGANLYDADLRNANLEDIKINIDTIGYNLSCPEEGSFIGYKKSRRCIVKLLIPEDAKRSNATTFKCRCDKAKVLDIEDIDTGEKVKEVSSNYDLNFIYKVGEIVAVENFDENRWNECAPGIHFFMNKENALNYQ